MRVVRAMRFTHTPLHCKVTGVEKRSTSSRLYLQQQQLQLQRQLQQQQQQRQQGRQAGKLCVTANAPMPKASLQNRQNLVCLCPSQLGAVVVVVAVAVVVVLVAVVAVVVAIVVIDCACQIMRKTKGVFRTGCHCSGVIYAPRPPRTRTQ